MVLALFLSGNGSFVRADEGAVDPGADFQGYMEEKEKQDTAREKYNQMVDEHELWRQTTTTGWVVRQLQAVGSHFAPFFIALSEILQGETDDSASAFILTMFLRILVISAYIVAAYAVARIINNVFGQEIVMEEEVVIELDEDENDDNDQNDESKKDQ
eukprot:CAMPEP_0168720384 /NCGR_PEP_ID=MMETSP0724-20121128/1532_1 /TAXON_ID=265536 /ORGANISM="Amphiprora sp., Strain CCMP467" /LENGTH=157 /DNA_ID=CAMNT_0008766979 /DNA_START=69 /DNA_END=542 /DNA_ORIENTATION=-